MTILQSRFCRATLSGRLAALLVLIVLAPVAGAQGNDPAAAPIVRLNGTLLEVMQQAKQLGVKGRYDKLAPVLTKTYDIASMAKVAAGPSWDSFTP